MKFSKYNTFTIFYNCDQADQEYEKIDIRGARVFRRARNLSEPAFTTILPKSYRNPIPISKAKYDDLQKLCNGNIIPEKHWEFYCRPLLTMKWKNVVDETDEDERGIDCKSICYSVKFVVYVFFYYNPFSLLGSFVITVCSFCTIRLMNLSYLVT